jgi:hypothetical protein
LNDDAFREAIIERKRRECLQLIAMDGRPFFPVIRPNLDWLRSRLAELSGLYRELEILEKAHDLGVLYAVEFRPEDLLNMTYKWSSGAAVFAPIPASRIRHKVEITDTSEIRTACNDSGRSDEFFGADDWREESPDGLICKLAGREEDIALKAGTDNVYLELEKLVDKAAGTDESLELAIENGSPLLVQWAREELSRRNSLSM